MNQFAGEVAPRVCCHETGVSSWKKALFTVIAFSEKITPNKMHRISMSILYSALGLLANTCEAAAMNRRIKIFSRGSKLLFLGSAATLVISILFQLILNKLKPDLSKYKQYLVNCVQCHLDGRRFETAFNSIKQINQILVRSMNSACSEYDSEFQEAGLNELKKELMTMYVLRWYCRPYQISLHPDAEAVRAQADRDKIEFMKGDLSKIFTDINSEILDYYYRACVEHIWSVEDPKGAYGQEGRASIFIDNIHAEGLKSQLQRKLMAKTQSHAQERARIDEAGARVAADCLDDFAKKIQDPKVVTAFSEVMSAESSSHTVKIEVVGEEQTVEKAKT